MKRLFFSAIISVVVLSVFAQTYRPNFNQADVQRTQQHWFQQGTNQQQHRPNVSNTSNRGQRFSIDEYRKRQKEFFTKRANLTEQEAEKFFPVYNELQQKKMQINHQSRQDAVRQQQPLSEEECLKAIDAFADAQIRIAQLEKEYLEKFKKILPASKILAIQRAEDQFNSELVKEMQRSRPNIPATNRPSANMPQGNRPPAARQ